MPKCLVFRSLSNMPSDKGVFKKTKKIIEMCPTKKIQRSPSNVLSKKGCHTKEMCPKKKCP
jgi:flavoprotein